jgi:hypothetical protein
MDLASQLATATFGPDGPRLRATLDELRQLLVRPYLLGSLPGTALVHDRGAIAASIREVLDRLSANDLTAIRALSGFVSEYRPEQRATELGELFAGLQLGWQARVRRILGTDGVSTVGRLLASPAPDVLRILRKEDDENAHSDLIAWLLTPSQAPTVAPRALRALASRFGDDRWFGRLDDAIRVQSLSVRREVVIARDFCAGDDLARVDICVCGPGFLLALENKVWSREHHDQTRTYWDWMAPMRELRGGIILSPSGAAASCPEFRAMTYLELVSALVEGPSSSPITQSEEIVLASYLKTLARDIIQVEMRAVRELAAMEQR